MKKLDLQYFIEQHSDWESILQVSPYCFQITRDKACGRNLIIFKYNQIDTKWDKAGHIAAEARGIVLDEDTLEVVNYGFDKFFNSTEPYADKIDAQSMRSTVKIDGSIIKVRKFEDGQLLISTNGTINAYNAPVAEQVGCSFKSFGSIVEDVLVRKFGSVNAFKDRLDADKTYIFEMVSPWTRVVTPFHENDMYLIGCRWIDPDKDFAEIPFWECSLKSMFKTPDILDFASIDKCLEYAQTLDWTSEGYVVMDKHFHRVKVKNASWLAVHHLCENHTMSYRRAVEIVRSNEIDEVVGYFPEFESALLDVKNRYWKKVADVSEAKTRLDGFIAANGWDMQPSLIEAGGRKRKDIAIWITKNFPIPGLAFGLIDKKIESVKKWFDEVPAEKLARTLGYKERKES